jgi:hypothetical protein
MGGIAAKAIARAIKQLIHLRRPLRVKLGHSRCRLNVRFARKRTSVLRVHEPARNCAAKKFQHEAAAGDLAGLPIDLRDYHEHCFDEAKAIYDRCGS